MFNKIITDELIDKIEHKEIELKDFKKKIRYIKKESRKLYKENGIDLVNETMSSLDEAVADFDKLCLAVGCKRSFTKMP